MGEGRCSVCLVVLRNWTGTRGEWRLPLDGRPITSIVPVPRRQAIARFSALLATRRPGVMAIPVVDQQLPSRIRWLKLHGVDPGAVVNVSAPLTVISTEFRIRPCTSESELGPRNRATILPVACGPGSVVGPSFRPHNSRAPSHAYIGCAPLIFYSQYLPLPVGIPRYRDPSDSQVSAMIFTPCFRATEWMASRSAGCPKASTYMMALVFSVMAGSIAEGSMQRVCGVSVSPGHFYDRLRDSRQKSARRPCAIPLVSERTLRCYTPRWP